MARKKTTPAVEAKAQVPLQHAVAWGAFLELIKDCDDAILLYTAKNADGRSMYGCHRDGAVLPLIGLLTTAKTRLELELLHSPTVQDQTDGE